MPTKEYSGFLVVDWRDDDLRFRKTRPGAGDRGPTEYPIEVSVEVEVPEFDIPELAADMKVPEPQVREAVAAEAFEAGETPEWHAAAEQALDHFADEAHAVDPAETEFDDLVSKAVGYVLRRCEGYPPVEQVEERIEDALESVARGGAEV